MVRESLDCVFLYLKTRSQLPSETQQHTAIRWTKCKERLLQGDFCGLLHIGNLHRTATNRTWSKGTSCFLVKLLYQHLPDQTWEKLKNFSQHSQWLGWDLHQASPEHVRSVTTTPGHWAAAEDHHIIHIWIHLVRIHATYHTCIETPTAVYLPRSSETVSILTTGFSCGWNRTHS